MIPLLGILAKVCVVIKWSFDYGLRRIFHGTSRPCTHIALTHARSSGNAEIAVR